LFTGSEGTLGIVAEAVLKLIPKPAGRQVIMAYFDTVEAAVNAVNKFIAQKVFPSTIDFMDKKALQTVERFKPSGLLCDKEAALVIEVEGDLDRIPGVLENAASIQYSKNEEEYEKIWAARRASMAACAQLKPNVTTDDVTVPRQNLAKLVNGIRSICEKYGLTCCLIGHVGDGSVHPQIPVDFRDEDEYRRYKLAKNEIYDLTASLDGVLSGEHGIGLLKREHIGKVVDPLALHYMREIKKIFDPNNILNPGKIF
ncbi:MAG: glycolate oxidase subunit GlcD, partial [Heliobacteriaceae bacterium]|nr:glycolate oxidase subunit GlcD [Heliobacteriaceae bacterium]